MFSSIQHLKSFSPRKEDDSKKKSLSRTSNTMFTLVPAKYLHYGKPSSFKNCLRTQKNVQSHQAFTYLHFQCQVVS
jgi:hypothetical protein